MFNELSTTGASASALSPTSVACSSSYMVSGTGEQPIHPRILFTLFWARAGSLAIRERTRAYLDTGRCYK